VWARLTLDLARHVAAHSFIDPEHVRSWKHLEQLVAQYSNCKFAFDAYTESVALTEDVRASIKLMEGKHPAPAAKMDWALESLKAEAHRTNPGVTDLRVELLYAKWVQLCSETA